MLHHLVSVSLLSLVVATAQAQTPATDGAGDERADAPATDAGLEQVKPPVLPGGPDDLGRDKDPMVVDGDAGGMPAGFSPAGLIGGSADAVVQGGPSAPLPDGAVPVAGGADARLLGQLELALHGVVQAELYTAISDAGSYDTTFLPRELELDLVAGYGDQLAVRLDLNLLVSPLPQRLSFQADLTEEALFDALAEQAYVEWRRWGLTARVGKMNAPFGSEPIDAADRLTLGRSWLSQKAAPTLLTGVMAGYEVWPALSGFVLVANGWDRTLDGNLSFDGNRSKTLAGGLVHRLGQRADGSWLFEGTLAGTLGPEQRGVNDLRLMVDYSGTLAPIAGLTLALELLYAVEQGEGYNRQRLIDGKHAARWWAGMLTTSYDATATGVDALRGLRAAWRLELVHDDDLFLGLPHVPRMTTLLGSTLALRYALARAVDLALEHRADFERGDVAGLSTRRNVGNPFSWFVTQELRLGLVGQF